MRRHYMTDKELDKYLDNLEINKYTCKCSHPVYIPYNQDKVVCNWCGRYVFKDKKKEFEYRLKEKIK